MLKVVLEIFKGYTPVLLKGFPSIALVLSVLSLVIALTALSEAGSSDSTSPTTIQNDVLTLLKAEQVNALNRQLTTSQSDKLSELETIYTAMDQSLEQIVDDQKKLIQTQRDLSSEGIASKETLNLRLEGQLDLEKQLQSINNQQQAADHR